MVRVAGLGRFAACGPGQLGQINIDFFGGMRATYDASLERLGTWFRRPLSGAWVDISLLFLDVQTLGKLNFMLMLEPASPDDAFLRRQP